MLDELRQHHLQYHDTGSLITGMAVDYPDGATTGTHAHPRGQLLYATQGIMILTCVEGSWVLPPNRAAWLIAHSEHDVKMCGDVKIRTVFIDQSVTPSLPHKCCVVTVKPLLRELIAAATTIPIDYDQNGRDGRLMRLLVDELLLSDELPLQLPLPKDRRLRSICRHIVDNPANNITAETWGHRIGTTAKTIHRLFLKETGMTFAQWRQQARLLAALQRIAAGERIIDVALECGYSSHSAFTAMFRQHFGVTPSAFYQEPLA